MLPAIATVSPRDASFAKVFLRAPFAKNFLQGTRVILLRKADEGAVRGILVKRFLGNRVPPRGSVSRSAEGSRNRTTDRSELSLNRNA
jgi:hypothetical protein